MVIPRSSVTQTTDGQILSVAMATKASNSALTRAAKGRLTYLIYKRVMIMKTKLQYSYHYFCYIPS